MRIMIYSHTKNESEFKEDINFMEEHLHMKVDFFSCYEDAEYCVDTRTYDLVIFEYRMDIYRSYYNFLGYLKKKENVPTALFFSNDVVRDARMLKENYPFLKQIEEKEFSVLDIVKTETEFNENLVIKRDNIHIDLKDKKIFYEEKSGELTEIEFKKKFDFYVLLYFMRHYKSIININSLLDATCVEPEFTKDSIIESSISSIRKSFKSLVGVNPIKAFKKVGYRFSLNEE